MNKPIETAIKPPMPQASAAAAHTDSQATTRGAAVAEQVAQDASHNSRSRYSAAAALLPNQPELDQSLRAADQGLEQYLACANAYSLASHEWLSRYVESLERYSQRYYQLIHSCLQAFRTQLSEVESQYSGEAGPARRLALQTARSPSEAKR